MERNYIFIIYIKQTKLEIENYKSYEEQWNKYTVSIIFSNKQIAPSDLSNLKGSGRVMEKNKWEKRW